MNVLLRVSNFKSIEELELELAPLTILIGPPASGKSNILDSIALAGYFNRILLLNEEYGNVVSNLEPITVIARFNWPIELFRQYDLTEKISIEITTGSEEVKLSLWFEQSKLNIELNQIALPWDLTGGSEKSIQNTKSALERAIKGRLLTESRLYSYDRYGLASFDTASGNVKFLSCLRGLSYPRDYPKKYTERTWEKC